MRLSTVCFLLICFTNSFSQRLFERQNSFIGLSLGANASRISNINHMVNDKERFPLSHGTYSDKSEWTAPEVNVNISYLYAYNEKFIIETKAGYSAHGGKMHYQETANSDNTIDKGPLQYDMWFKFNYFTIGQYLNYNFKDKDNGFYVSSGINVDLIRNEDNILYESNDINKSDIDPFERDNLRTIFKGHTQLHFDVLVGYYFKLNDRSNLNINISGTCPFLSPYDAIETQANQFLKIEKRNLFTILRFNVGITFPSLTK